MSDETDGADDSIELPHRVRHSSPRTNRKQLALFVDDDAQVRLSRWEQLAAIEFDESVYSADVRLAALRVGLDNDDEAFLGAMRDIGYDFP